MSKLLTCIGIASIFLLADACKVQVKIRSQTKNKFRIQVFIPSIKQKTERVLFTEKSEKKLRIVGENCANKKWVVRTWKPDGKGDWTSAKQNEAKIDGEGWFRIVVDDNLFPRLHDRLGIMCSEGELCG